MLVLITLVMPLKAFEIALAKLLASDCIAAVIDDVSISGFVGVVGSVGFAVSSFGKVPLSMASCMA